MHFISATPKRNLRPVMIMNIVTHHLVAAAAAVTYQSTGTFCSSSLFSSKKNIKALLLKESRIKNLARWAFE